MLQAPPIAGIPEFWETVSSAPHRLLALDYDGTLAPFRIERMEARPLPGILDALAVLSDRRTCPNTSLAVISGRPVNELAGLLHPLSVPMYGAHGYEYLDVKKNLRLYVPEKTVCEALNAAVRAAQAAGLSDLTEKKISSVAVHVRGRGNARHILDRIFERWGPILETSGLTMRRFDGGVELRSTDRSKATAVSELLEACPPRDPSGVYR